MTNNAYFLYARKSTDDGTRQVRSIVDQLAEGRDLAAREGLVILEALVEKQTAKKPGRPVFNEMLDRIEKGEAAGIIAWHPDRLARNSLDGGRIIWLVDTGKILDLKFPSYRFDVTPQGKLSLAIEFGISKYYVDKLSEDIKRGQSRKLKDGLWPKIAPLGYKNDHATKRIVPDPVKAPLIRKAFTMYATGDYTLRQVKNALNDLGLVGIKGGTLWVANYQYILKNPVYYGTMRYGGEYYEGKHEPLITKALFDQAQAVMSEKSKPKSNNRKPYLYRGMFHCGECGRLVTTETQKGHNYLRCSKWEVTCSQRYVREEKITEAVADAIGLVALPVEWTDWLLAKTDEEAEVAKADTVGIVHDLKDKIKEADMRLDRLMAAYIDRVVTLPEYKTAKNKMLDEKRILAENLASVEDERSHAFEPLKSFILAVKHAKTLGETGKPEEQRDFFKTITSNPNVFNRELRFEPRGAWQLVIRQGSFVQQNTAPAIAGAVFLGETHHVVQMRRGGESKRLKPTNSYYPSIYILKLAISRIWHVSLMC